MSQFSTPVAIFIFNRPENTKRVFEIVAAIRPARLLVIADGPRRDKKGETQLCEEARSVFENIDWPCELQTNYSETNLGCKQRMASGFGWVFSHVSEAILLEDDCLPDTTFFNFCSEMLARYRDDERINMVRGSNLLGGQRVTSDSYYFSRLYNTWGWATWARAWSHYDVEMREWPSLRDSGWLERQLEGEAIVQITRRLFDETYAGRIDTWDYQWAFSGWLRGSMAIIPENNLITNIGFGEGATHTHDNNHHLANLASKPLRFPLRHPRLVKVLNGADRRELRLVYSRAQQKNNLWMRLRRRLSLNI
jgi:hypothetical protein